jgi:hypothetical protein
MTSESKLLVLPAEIIIRALAVLQEPHTLLNACTSLSHHITVILNAEKQSLDSLWREQFRFRLLKVNLT